MLSTDNQLKAMVQGYLEAALFAECDEDGKPLSERFDLGDFSDPALDEATATCGDFIELLGHVGIIWQMDYTPEGLGHYLWLTHNRHGAGFWSQGTPTGVALTDNARPYGVRYVYVNDDHQLDIL